MIGVTAVTVEYSCGMVLFYECEEQFDYGNQISGGPCSQLEKAIGTFDLAFTVFFNGLLMFCAIDQNRRMQQGDIWRKNRRMLFQLLTVSLLHVVVWITIVTVIRTALANCPPPNIVLDFQAGFVLLNATYIAVRGTRLFPFLPCPRSKQRSKLY